MGKHQYRRSVARDIMSRTSWAVHHVLLVHIISQKHFHGLVKIAQQGVTARVVQQMINVLVRAQLVGLALKVQRLINVPVYVKRAVTAPVVQQMIDVLVFAKQELTRMLDPQIA